MPGVSLRPREEVLASYTVVKGYHAYGWPIDDERGVYFVQPDVVCLDSDGEQLGLKRKFLNGDEKGSLSDFLLPDLSTALIAIDSTARGAGVKPEMHSPEYLMDRIDEFVRMAKIGFCYSFSGSYVDPSIRTKR